MFNMFRRTAGNSEGDGAPAAEDGDSQPGQEVHRPAGEMVKLKAFAKPEEQELYCAYRMTLEDEAASPGAEGHDVVLVVDVSGSMGSVANPQGEGIAKLFSCLDVVKHAIQTVAASLNASDRLSLVTFDTNVMVNMPLTHMDEDGQLQAVNSITPLEPGSTTALWDGLKAGLEILRNGGRQDANWTVLLLTDGRPNPEVLGGELNALKNYRSTSTAHERAVLHTFGIGYDLNSELLESLATEAGGAYSFIPDGSMVGTVVINAIANVAVTVYPKGLLELAPKSADQLIEVLGDLKSTKNDATGVVSVSVGHLRAGQTRHVLVRVRKGVSSSSDVFALPDARLFSGKEYGNTEPDTLVWTSDTGNDRSDGYVPVPLADAAKVVAVQKARADFVVTVRKALKLGKLDLDAARSQLAALAQRISQSDAPDAHVLDDLTGQVAEAFSRQDWFSRWGLHYLLSLVGAHRDERCNNFKDPGVQGYGGSENSGPFHKMQEQLDAIFNNIPPPEPYHGGRGYHDSHVTGFPSIGAQSGGVTASLVSFSDMFNSVSNGCFVADTLIKLASGKGIRIDRLRKGDMVATPEGNAQVVCMTRYICADGRAEIVRLPNLGPALTAWHPVKWEGRWAFPANIAEKRMEDHSAVYNVILEPGHSAVFANGVAAVTLGHGLKDDVVRHPYLGTYRVKQDLARLPGWDTGIVTLLPDSMQRDPRTGQISGYTDNDLHGDVVASVVPWQRKDLVRSLS